MQRQSYVHGQGREPLKYVTFPALLEERAQETPEKTAHVFRYFNAVDDDNDIGRKVVTFQELQEKSLRLASSMLSIGMKPHGHVMIVGSNCPEYVYFDFACMRISVLMIRVPINMANPDTVLAIIKKFNVRALILDNVQLANKIDSVLPGFFDLERNASYGIDCLTDVIFLKKPNQCSLAKWKSTEDLLQLAPDKSRVSEIQTQIDPDQPAAVFPTSGSTGTPKFALHSHFSLVNGFWDFKHFLKVDDPMFIFLSDKPFAWGAGAPYIATLFGQTMVHLDPVMTLPGKRVDLFLRMIEEESVTDAICMTYLLYDMMEEVRENGLKLPSSLKTIFVLGERVPATAMEFAERTFDQVSLSYGMTEVIASLASLITQESDGDSISVYWMDPLPYQEIKVTDSLTGRLLQRGQVGRLYVRCPHTMIGYLDNEKATRAVVSTSGWVDTGDLAIMNERNQVKVIGRQSDVIVRGGISIHPSTMEAVLLKHPGVFRTSIVAVPDPVLVNEICACVIAKAHTSLCQDELRSFCQQENHNDTSLIVPKYFMIVDNFPKGSTGKMDKTKLAEKAKIFLTL